MEVVVAWACMGLGQPPSNHPNSTCAHVAKDRGTSTQRQQPCLPFATHGTLPCLSLVTLS